MSEVSLRMLNCEPHRSVDETTVAALAESIRDIGKLLHPVVVDKELNVLAGVHRVHAARRLGWETIPVVEVDVDPLLAELITLDENLIRNEGTTLERAKALRRRKEIYEHLHPETKHGKQKEVSRHNGDSPRAERFTKDVAEKTGVSERSVQRHVRVAERLAPEAEKIVEQSPLADSITDLEQLARMPADQQAKVAKRAVESGETVKRAAKSLKRADQVEQIKAYVPPKGEYSLIVRDPAWPYEDQLDGSDAARGGTPYPTASIDELCAQKIPAAKSCVLLLWVTNAHLIDGSATRVFEAWGFEPKTMATWPKPKMGVGRWLRGQTEHVIVAVRGKPVVDLKNQTTLLPAWKVGKHSAKPDEFFAWAAKLFPCAADARIEMDARKARKGWACSGSEVPPPAKKKPTKKKGRAA